MKRYLLTVTAATVLVLGLAACDHSVLDVTPRTELAESAVFADVNLADAFLNQIYSSIDHNFGSDARSTLSGETDNVHGSVANEAMSLRSPSNSGGLPGNSSWNGAYSRIRQANVFLERIADAEFDEARKESMAAQARFLRAFFYHNLLNFHGGVPNITHVYGLDDDFEIARNSFQETVAFIVADADAAAAVLPAEHSASDLGRVTKGAALALKSRVLLYAASDLYTENPSGQPETGYTGSVDRTALWTAARDAAKAVIDLGVYGLFSPDPASPEEAAENYYQMTVQKVSEEQIFVRYYLTSMAGAPRVNRSLGPNGYHNWGGRTPTQEFVDKYRRLDGSEFDWNNPAHAAAPYENRDPRLRGSILYDGVPLRPRPSNVQHLDPYGIIQTFRGLRLPDGTVVPGLDTRAGPIEDWNGSYTGYYQRKYLDATVDGQFFPQDVPSVFFRYAEVLLNYAEASTELGDLGEAVWALNEIKRRSGMPELTGGESQAQLREEYRHERTIELAFENHGLHDVRRWMTAPDVLNQPGMAIDIFLEGDDPIDRSTWRNYTYEPVHLFPRQWQDHFYFWPIPLSEMQRNSLLVQNPLY